MTHLTMLKEWQALRQHKQHVSHQEMRDWFTKDPARLDRFSLQTGDITFDYSRHRVTDETIDLLCALAHAVDLPNKMNALFSGSPINLTEKQAV